eukprot:gnl/MRDRNA2_/MRDRNA2_91656_c0_seq1.p1 gnl/MRDRNA2_/MRDRNA2_91656_c0~~gnl/MRDRNA2_/MRDRNA2_91656_c0_seq1.p1  ORF type:complete len:435 (+),score=115.26 gnl/MRDRNA2_/MRDRNA2_91656_c0_seq1:98-1402(+)
MTGASIQTDDVICDYSQELKDVAEYLDGKGAYDIFDTLLKELLTKQPDDPLQCMIDTLKTEIPSGPLRIIVASASGTGRSKWCQKIADSYGLKLISPGQLLRGEGVEVDAIDFADDEKVIKLVEPELMACNGKMQGWVLDGFPRTNMQASWLKEKHIVPSQVFLMNMPKEKIYETAQLKPDVLEQKLKLHFRHGLAALEAYIADLKQIDISFGTDDEMWAEIDAEVKLRPYSKAPKRAPRTVLLGPPGSDNKAYAEKLADSLGAVVVDGTVLQKDAPVHEGTDTLSEAVFARISQIDCQQNGWVLTNYPDTLEQAEKLKNSEFAPIRSVLLECSMQTCMRRLSTQFVDPVTGTVWTRPPKDEVIRKRLKRNAADVPQYVQVRYEHFMAEIDAIFDTISRGGTGARVTAEGDAREVSDIIAEFVERPLSFELLNV